MVNRKLKVAGEVGGVPQNFVPVTMPSEFIIYTPPLHHPFKTKPSSSSAAAAATTDHNNDHSTKPITNQGFESSMALTVFTLLGALFFMGFFSVYLRCVASGRRSSRTHILSRSRRRGSPVLLLDPPPNPSVRPPKEYGLDPITVGSLPIMPYSTSRLRKSNYNGAKEEEEEEAMEAGDECVVCLSEFEEEEMVKVIPFCEHLFHPDCIDLWFRSHSSCPLCRSTQLFPIENPSPNSDLRKQVGVECDDHERKSTVRDGGHEMGSMEAVLGRTCSCSSSSSSNSRSEVEETVVVVVLRRSSSWPS